MSDDPKRLLRTAPADEDRDAILERRKRFIAVAMAGLAGAAVACSNGGPGDVSTTGDAGDAGRVDAPPEPCLSPPYVPRPDAGGDADPDGGTPQACLSLPADSG